MSKGANNEREAHELLSRAGYAAYRPATVRYGENDVWGLFDVLAVCADDRPTRLVQIKSNGANSPASYFRKAWLFASESTRVELWSKYDREGWRVDQAACGGVQESSDGRKDGYRTAVDERSDDRVEPHSGTDMTLGDAVVEWLEDQRGN